MSCKLSKNKARKAGEVLACEDASEEEKREAIAVVNQWREAHRELFCTIPTELKAIAYAVDPDAIVVARIKRIDTIVGKLRRPGLNMKLNEMFDIVGCRIITKDIHPVTRYAFLLSTMRCRKLISMSTIQPKRHWRTACMQNANIRRRVCRMCSWCESHPCKTCAKHIRTTQQTLRDSSMNLIYSCSMTHKETNL